MNTNRYKIWELNMECKVPDIFIGSMFYNIYFMS